MKLPKYSITFFGSIFLITFAILMYILFASISNSLEAAREREAAEAAESSRLAAEASAIDPFKPTESSREESSVPANSSRDEESSAVKEESSKKNTNKNYDGIIKQHLERLTLEQKIYQMFIITPESLTGYDVVTAAGSATSYAFAQTPVGGLIYDEDNMVDSTQLSDMLTNIQTYSYDNVGLPLFTCIIEEGGDQSPIANSWNFDVATFDHLSTMTSADEAANMGSTIGAYLARFGFNFNFAPSIETPALSLAAGFSEGMQRHNILTTLKYAPAVDASDAEEQGFSAIMVDHSTTANGEIASLSGQFVTGTLRNTYGYTGLIITAPLNESAISDPYYSSEAAILAVQAGCDLLLMPNDFSSAYSGLLDAVYSGVISQERIDESLTRILRAKMQITMG